LLSDIGDAHHSIGYPEKTIVKIAEEECAGSGSLRGKKHVDIGNLREDRSTN
jgi:hypothetical protein